MTTTLLQPTDEQIDAIAERMASTLSASGGLRAFARAVLAAQPLHEQLREMGEAHAAQPAPVPDENPKCPDCGHRALGVGCDMRVPHRAAQPAPVPVPLTGHVYLVQYGTQCLEAFADRSAAVAYAYNIGLHAYVACVAVRTPEYVTHVFGIAASPEVP
jgi:hypothetical protein